MTRAVAAPVELLLDELRPRLAALPGPDRRTAVEGLLRLLGTLPDDDPAAAGRSPVLLSDWAADGGRDGTDQRLAVPVVPGPTRLARTATATGRALLSNGFLGADLIHVPAGSGFAPHTHPGDHLLFVLGGRGTITAAGQIVPTAPGQAYLVDGSAPHAVGAVEDHLLLSVGAGHQALDSEHRQLLVPPDRLLDPEHGIHCLVCDVVAATCEQLGAAGCPHSPHGFH